MLIAARKASNNSPTEAHSLGAPLRTDQLDLAEFVECCGYQLRHMMMGLIDRQTAVDGCQFLAEHGGFVEAFGQDACQEAMSRVWGAS